MIEKCLHIARDGQHIFLYAERRRLTGRHAERITRRIQGVLAASGAAHRIAPAHDADVFAWVVECASTRAAARFFRRLLESHRLHPI